jgi:hypothetical protein
MERLRSQFEELCPGKDDELDVNLNFKKSFLQIITYLLGS